MLSGNLQADGVGDFVQGLEGGGEEPGGLGHIGGHIQGLDNDGGLGHADAGVDDLGDSLGADGAAELPRGKDRGGLGLNGDQVWGPCEVRPWEWYPQSTVSHLPLIILTGYLR